MIRTGEASLNLSTFVAFQNPTVLISIPEEMKMRYQEPRATTSSSV